MKKLGAAIIAFGIWSMSSSTLVWANCDVGDLTLDSHTTRLTYPNGKGPFPLVVLTHGGKVGRINKGFKNWINWYKKLGIASLYVDSFTWRSCRPVNWQEGEETRKRDFDTLLKIIPTIKNIDQRNIFFQGHSAGTSISIRAGTLQRDSETQIRVSGVINFYPATYTCQVSDLSEPKWTSEYITIIGELDEPANACWEQQGTPSVKIEGAYHAFDLGLRGSYQKTCRSYRSREFGEMEMCFQLNDTARDQARDEILKFLNRVLIT